jgi:23S rRNA (guanine745-N1)-methyltransferase
VAIPPLACTVRRCALPLHRSERRLTCPSGHSYDVARGGYVNLLQPQDKRSAAPGDTQAAIEARTRLLDQGVGRCLVDAVVERVGNLGLGGDRVVVDLGSGAGDMLAALSARYPVNGIGIDLSARAVALAARRFPSLTWVVGNADRRLPVLDEKAQLVLSIYGRRNPTECARILATRGALLVAVPAGDDLVELRAAIQGAGLDRDRTEAVAAEHEALFRVVERTSVREHHRLERATLLDLLRATYRGDRRTATVRAGSLDSLDVTLASDVVVLVKR